MYNWTIATKREHTASWYIIAGIATISLAVWGFLTQIYALSVVIVILAGVYLLIENNAPDNADAVVNENGVGVGGMFYDYGQIENFGLIFDDQVPKFLQISLKAKGLRLIQIPFSQDINPSEIRAFLLNYLPETDKKNLTFSDRLADRLGL